MNGKVSKRIRRARKGSGIPVKQLKREYLALPYHRRSMPKGVVCKPHKEAITRSRRILTSNF